MECHFCSMVSRPPAISSGMVAWQLGRFQEKEKVCSIPWGLGSELTHSHFCRILLAKARHKCSLDSRGRKTDSTSWWDELKSHRKGSWQREKRKIVAIFAANCKGSPPGPRACRSLFLELFFLHPSHVWAFSSFSYQLNYHLFWEVFLPACPVILYLKFLLFFFQVLISLCNCIIGVYQFLSIASIEQQFYKVRE